MRRILVLASAVVLVDTMLYAALTPLLPGYADEYELTKIGAGLLVAAYPAGVLAAAVPAGLVTTRLGSKLSVVTGMSLIAVASLAFGFGSAASVLGAARFVQGLGSALSWAGALAWLIGVTPRERRGEMMGAAIGAAVVGALLGPVVGAAASIVGSEWAFAAVSVLALALAVRAGGIAGTARESQPLSAVRVLLAERRFLGGLWLMVLPALLFGVMAVLAPLELGGLGWGAASIGALFLSSAALEALLNPFVGRFSDRRGRLLPVRAGLVASTAVLLGLAWASASITLGFLVVAAAVSFGVFYAPGLALLSEGAERRGVAQGLAFGLMNAAWAVGNVVGPAAGGAFAEAAGDASAYLTLAVVCVATLLVALWVRS